MEMSHSCVCTPLPRTKGRHCMSLQQSKLLAVWYCKIARDADTGHARLAKYVTCKMVSRLIRAVQYFQLDVLGAALVTRFSTSGDIDDITRAVNLFREALALYAPGHPSCHTPFNDLALALQKRYGELDVNEDS